MKRYLLFVFTGYEACGGWSDLGGSYDTEQECIDMVVATDYWYDMMQIVDTTTEELKTARVTAGETAESNNELVWIKD